MTKEVLNPVDETKKQFNFKKSLLKKIIIPAIAVGVVLLITLTVMTIINNARTDKIEDYLSGKTLITDTIYHRFKIYTFSEDNTVTMTEISLSDDENAIDSQNETCYSYSVKTSLFGKSFLKYYNEETRRNYKLPIETDEENDVISIGNDCRSITQFELDSLLKHYEEGYVQGTCTTTRFYSKWLGLQFDVPSTMKMIDPKVVANANKNNRSGEIIEMSAYKNVSAQSPSVQISVKKANGKTVKQAADDVMYSIRSSESSASVNGIDIQSSWDTPYEFSWLGETYLVYSYQYKTYYNNTLYRSGDTWILFRQKGDRIISVNCGATSGSGATLEDILDLFQKYE